MRTLGLTLGTLLLSLSVSGQKAQEVEQPWDFERHYQITMVRSSLRHAPERGKRDLELQVLHADMARIWEEPLEPEELLEAILGCLEGHKVEVKRSPPRYEWIKYANCFWEYRCVQGVLITIDPEDDPIELRIQAFMPR